MTEAFNLANTRVKKEYSGLRRSGLKSVRLIKDTDEEYENDIVEATRTNSETLSDNSNEITNAKPEKELNPLLEHSGLLDEAFSKMMDNQKLYKIVVTPGRKPRKRDLNKDYTVIPASSISDAEDKVISQFSSNGVELKRKWISVTPTSIKELVNTKYIEADELDINEEDVNELKEILYKNDKVEVSAVSRAFNSNRFSNNKIISNLSERMHGNLNDATEASMSVDESGYIVELETKFIAARNIKPIEFMITLVPKYGPSPRPIKVLAETAGNAIAYVLCAIKHERVSSKYKDIENISILNKETGKITNVEFSHVREVKTNE